VYTGQCPVLQEDAAPELGSLGKLQRLLRYNSPDMSGIHRTVRCNNGATTTSAPTATCGRIKCAPARAEFRQAHAGAPDTLQCMSGAPPDIQAGPASGIQRSNPNGFGDVAGAPDMSGAPYDSQPHQTASLVVGAINTPNHPTFMAFKFSTSQPLTRASHSILDTPKRSNPLQFHTRI
jgi:hypothetical protein